MSLYKMFRSEWVSLAAEGHCDDLDGVEYRRAWQDFCAADRSRLTKDGVGLWILRWVASNTLAP